LNRIRHLKIVETQRVQLRSVTHRCAFLLAYKDLKMKRTTINASLLACAMLPLVAQAFGNHQTWTSGFAQGSSEYVILGKGKSQLYLACGDGSRSATLIFTDPAGHDISMDSGKRLLLKTDEDDAVDISDTDSHAGEGSITSAWNHLRNGKQVTVSGENVRSATFTLNGAGKVLPEFGTQGCVSKFVL
jgi:hypothetical protein